MSKFLRTILVSDIHGCIDEFNELVKKLSYNKETDRLILLGDLIDRGPDSVAIVAKAREMKLECVMGNHEFKFLKWYRNHNVHNMQSYYLKLSDADVNFINNMNSYIHIPEQNTIIVHAGLRGGISLAHQNKNDLYHIRFMSLNKEFISLKKISKLGKENTGAHFWTKFWYGPENVVYGHQVHSLIDPLIEEILPEVFCYGLDTGCCFGGRLTALILETKEIVQVQSNKIYFESKFDIKNF